MVTERTARSYLRRSITLAEKLEDEVKFKARQKKFTFVGFGFLVRNRRLAQAILKLDRKHAYEARMFLRSMIEININYAWISLRDRDRRANRFLKFQSLEALSVIKDLSDSIDPSKYRSIRKKYISERAKFRHLFRNRNKKGKLRWDTNWASGASLKTRLNDVLKSETGKYDGFLYALYSWTSSAIHGGPGSLSEVLELNGPLMAKLQPESDPIAQIKGAFLSLLSTIELLAKDAKLPGHLGPELTKLKRAVNGLKRRWGTSIDILVTH